MTAERDTEEPTMRDILAAIAMHALLTRDAIQPPPSAYTVSRRAYEQADAMLEEKERAK